MIMTLHEKHIKKIELVNNADTEALHNNRMLELRSWREGVQDAGKSLDLCACDMHYIAKGIDRPMCCGVWLDWEPHNAAAQRSFAVADGCDNSAEVNS
jgi:hypothetical protein